MSENNSLFLREVPFHGDVILAGQVGEDIWVDPKPVCSAFGIDWDTQRKKIVSSEAEGGWASTVKMTVESREGDPREVVLITLESFLVWLTTISVNRVDEQYREKLCLYQKEASRALTGSVSCKIV